MEQKTSDCVEWVVKEACRQGASACDAIAYDSTSISTSRRMRKPEGIERSENNAIGLRVWVGAQQAIVSSTDTSHDTLKELAQRAVAMAKVAPADPDSTLAPESLYAHTIPDLDLFDAQEPEMKWLMDQCETVEESALCVPGITNSDGADASYSASHIYLAIHNGRDVCFAERYSSSHFSVSVSVLAGEGTGMERDYDFTSSHHRSALADAASIGRSAADRTLKRLNPRKVTTGNMPVIFDPRVSRGLLGALAGAISGSSIARGSSFLKDALHERIFPESIRIIDDPHIVRGFGSKPFDGEGVKNQKYAIIDNGVLATWLLDVRTANKLKMTSTGHASRGIGSPPSPSTTNFYMEAGNLSPEALISDIKNGLYVTEAFGMGVNTVTGDYSQGASGFWIENGVITYPVSEITIAGHLREMFRNLTPANDLTFRYATNAPTLRIESMTVAGT